MLRNLFDIGPGEKVSDFEFIFQSEYWGFALLLFIGLIGFAIYLYRSESWLARNRRLIMGGCYVLAGFLIVLLLLEPALLLKSTRSQKNNLIVLLLYFIFHRIDVFRETSAFAPCLIQVPRPGKLPI